MFQLFVFWTAIDACLLGVLLPSSGTFWESVRLLPLSPNKIVEYLYEPFLSGYSKGYSFILFEFCHVSVLISLCLFVIMQLYIHLLYKKHLYCPLTYTSCSLYSKSKFRPPRTVTKKGSAVPMAELPFLRQIHWLQGNRTVILNLPRHIRFTSLPPHPLCPLLHTSIQRRRC